MYFLAPYFFLNDLKAYILASYFLYIVNLHNYGKNTPEYETPKLTK